MIPLFSRFNTSAKTYRLPLWKEMDLALQAGFPLNQALETIKSRDFLYTLSLKTLRKQLQEGKPLSAAAEKAPRLFPSKYLPYLRQGEKCGAVPTLFSLMLKRYHADLASFNSALSFFIYPGTLCAITTSVFIILNVFVVPVFRKIFLDYGIKLAPHIPLFETAVVICALLALGWLLQSRLSRVPGVRRFYEALPYCGRAFHFRFWTEFTRALSQALSSGIAVPDALEAAGTVAGPASAGAAFSRLSARAKEGVKLSEVMREDKSFPESLVWTVAQGELMGNLPEALSRLTDRYEKARDLYTEHSLDILGTVLIVLLALGTGSWVFEYYRLIFSLPLPLM